MTQYTNWPRLFVGFVLIVTAFLTPNGTGGRDDLILIGCLLVGLGATDTRPDVTK